MTRRVAISGAAGAIGSETAGSFARSGAQLVLMDRDMDALRKVRDGIGREDAELVQYDQSSAASISSAIEKVGAVDVFVNNAALLVRKPLLETTDEEVERVLTVNVLGATRMALGFARAMSAEKRGGVILNVASHQAFVGGGGRGIYAMSKAAMVQFTRTAAVEWQPLGIRVIGLAPGPVDSPMTADVMANPAKREAVLSRLPLGRLMAAAEIANLIHMMCDGSMACVVGQTLIADGGAMLS